MWTLMHQVMWYIFPGLSRKMKTTVAFLEILLLLSAIAMTPVLGVTEVTEVTDGMEVTTDYTDTHTTDEVTEDDPIKNATEISTNNPPEYDSPSPLVVITDRVEKTTDYTTHFKYTTDEVTEDDPIKNATELSTTNPPEDDSLSTGAIAGIVVGSVAGVVVISGGIGFAVHALKGSTRVSPAVTSSGVTNVAMQDEPNDKGATSSDMGQQGVSTEKNDGKEANSIV